MFKKKLSWASVVIGIVIAGTVFTGTAFAAGWFSKAEKVDNTLTTGEAIVMSLAGDVADGTGMMPGDQATQAVVCSLDGADAAVLTLKFNDATLSEVFEISIDQGVTPITSDSNGVYTCKTLAADETVTITIKLKEDAASTYAGKTTTYKLTLDKPV